MQHMGYWKAFWKFFC